MVRTLDAKACADAMAHGEFSAELRGSAPAVAIVLTQSWCPQWVWMKRWLDAAGDEPGVDIYWLEYDREAFFDEFRTFKEEVLGNDQVPYVRYYRNGVLVRQSNYIDRGGFLRFLGPGA
jgi:hypothetical protein